MHQVDRSQPRQQTIKGDHLAQTNQRHALALAVLTQARFECLTKG